MNTNSKTSSPAPGKRSAASSRRDSTGLIHRQLREAILQGDLASGTELSQVQIAGQFEVSRGPVREALRLLEREGLIEARVNHRARVAAFSVSDLEGLYALRIATESLAIRISVPQNDDRDLEQLLSLLAEMDRLGDSDDRRGWEESHREFHRVLVAHAGERIVRTVEQLHDHAERYRRFAEAQDPQRRDPARIEHREIVEACRARDAHLASVRLARHLSRTALRVLMDIAPDHEPTVVRAALRQAMGVDDPVTFPERLD